MQPDLNKLKLAIIENNLTIDALAEKSTIPRSKLIPLLEGQSTFTVSEMDAVIHALDLSENRIAEIFLK